MKTLASCIVLASPAGLAAGQAPPAGAATADRDVVLVAHRGGIVPGYPENTLAAFRHAIENGADAIELDLRGTKDGRIVVMHDATVNRTTNGRGAVAHSSLAELRSLDAGQGERIPTYEEVLELVSGTEVLLVLDIKDGRHLDRRRVLQLAQDHGAITRILLGVRKLEDLRAFRALGGGFGTVGFVEEIDDIEPFVREGVDIIRLWPEWIDADPGLIGVVHALGKPVWAMTGDAPREELERFIRLGVDGIASDLPGVMRELAAAARR